MSKKIEIISDGNRAPQRLTLGLGRLFIPDERDRAFPAQLVLPKKAAAVKPYKYHNQSGWWGDQGDTPHCVGYSIAHWLEDGPITHAGIAPVLNPYNDIYRRAQDIDEWPGTDYDGTSVRAGMKAAQERGYVHSYYWATTIDEIVQCISNVGPVVVGTVWTHDMFFPDPKTGIIRPTGYESGGHAYVLNGYNLKKRLFRIKNSWGRLWGLEGNAWISFDDFKILLDNWGEACIAVEKKPAA